MNRIWASISFGFLSFSAQFAAAATPLTETRLMEFAQQNPHWNNVQLARQQVWDIKLKQAGRWADPRLEWDQESIDRGGRTERETILWLRQDLSPWGSSELEQELVEKQNQSEQLVLDVQQQAIKLKLRQQFYSALEVQKQMEALARYQSQLTEMTKVVEQRWKKGDVSRFDLLRIQNALAAADVELVGLQKQSIIHLQTLSEWVEHPIEQLEGALLPSIRTLETMHLSRNPLLQQVSLQLEQGETAQQLAQKQRYWPDLNVGIGYKQSNEINTSNGFQIGLSLSLPLFSQKKYAVELAQTQHQQASAEKHFLQQKLEVEFNHYLAQLHESINQANRWQTIIEQQNRPMVELARTSYRVGELTISELLDVYRSELNHRKQYLSSALQAREHFFQIQYLLGE